MTMHKHVLVAGIAVLLGVITFTQIQTIGSVREIVATLQSVSANQVGATAVSLAPADLAVRETTRIDLLKTVISSSTNPVAWGYITSLSDVNCQLRSSLNVPCTASSVLSVALSNISTSKGPSLADSSGVWLAGYPIFTFTLTNNGNVPAYVSKTPSLSLAIQTQSGASSTISSVMAVPPSSAGDTAQSLVIQPGTSRMFTYNVTTQNISGGSAGSRVNVTQINYGSGSTNGSNNTNKITSGLTNLFVVVP